MAGGVGIHRHQLFDGILAQMAKSKLQWNIIQIIVRIIIVFSLTPCLFDTLSARPDNEMAITSVPGVWVYFSFLNEILFVLFVHNNIIL